MKIPVSLLSTYLYCHRKLFLQEVLLLEEPPKDVVVMGSIRHQTHDLINKKEEKIVASIEKWQPLEELENLYKKEYLAILRKVIVSNKARIDELNIGVLDVFKKSCSFIIEESSIRASNVFDFIEANGVFGKDLWEKLMPKIISEMKVFSDELKLTGVIDQVHIYGDDYVPFELKTGRTPKDGVWPSHRIQIAAYSLLLEEKLNRKINEGVVMYLDTKEKRNISINPYMRDEVKRIVEEIILLIKSKEIPDYCDNENKCRKCGLMKTCYNKEDVNNLMKKYS